MLTMPINVVDNGRRLGEENDDDMLCDKHDLGWVLLLLEAKTDGTSTSTYFNGLSQVNGIVAHSIYDRGQKYRIPRRANKMEYIRFRCRCKIEFYFWPCDMT